MKEINLNNKSYDSETATVEKIQSEKNHDDNKPGRTLLQKLTTASFIVLCILICIFSIRTLNHFKTMKRYAISDADMQKLESINSEEQSTENVEYVDEVTYSPTEAAMEELSKSNNGKDWIAALNCPYTWSFKSDYEYNSVTIRCIWLCTHDETGELLAFRTADYDASTNTFSDVSVYTTLIGGTYIAAD